jgi:carboxymethylenebutenolidase
MRRLGIVLSLLLLLGGCRRHEASTTDTHEQHSGTAATAATQPAAVAASIGPDRMQLPNGNGALGYLALPPAKTAEKRPAIIVIQEWWGLTDWVKQQTDRFAQQGYVTLAVDLYRGKATDDAQEAHELMRGLPEDRAIADLKAGFDYLASRPDVDPARIGVIGWCMGGGYALGFATAEPRLKAAVMNYGRLITDQNTLAKIQPRLLGNFGADDRGIPAADVKAFGEALTKAGKLADIKIYNGVGHGFMSEDSEATRDAWRRIDGFFADTLRANMPNP